ncbi:hypothetical protein N656DRAFT_784469 [Canariomyces notabilis]|uniref:Uncharacterized protein n=1 Tax=Canariomyces notabilis TaxID=2074819 RepID=A0AAN6QEK5_9PEZI|nr:hypothetical protein N656DRAFT_784469 [Canariomyces arenarius]
MAHLPPNAAIFSPSVARAAASAAKDWSYIDAWLHRKFPRGPPSFERNADTLRVLLALAVANEAADEERAMIARLEAEALDQLRAHQAQSHSQSEPDNNNNNNNPLGDAREAILASLERSLTRDGQIALDSMAALAVQSGIAHPTPPSLAESLIRLTAESLTLEQTLSRLDVLTGYMNREAASTRVLSASLRPPSPSPHQHPDDNDNNAPEAARKPQANDDDDKSSPWQQWQGYHPPPTLALQNLETQRRIKALSSRVPELRDRAKSLSSPTTTSNTPSIEQVRQEEESYLALQAQKQDLEAQVRAFQGLPPDTERARHELESLRAELRRMEMRRDEVFEGLVERASPRKGGGGGRSGLG